MKRLINNLSLVVLSAAFAVLSAGCDKTYVEEDPSAGALPEIESFSPRAGAAGTEIIVTGKWLNAVNRATIGGEEVTIAERVSDTRLSLRADAAGRSGKIELWNAEGSVVSADTFKYETVIPELLGITDAQGAAAVSAEMEDHLFLEIADWASVRQIVLTSADETSEGAERKFAVTVADYNRDTRTAEIIVPYVNNTAACFQLEYYDYDSNVVTYTNDERTGAHLTVELHYPSFDDADGRIIPERAGAGLMTMINGSNLQYIEHVYITDGEGNEYDTEFAIQKADKLGFVIPAELAEDGEEKNWTVTASYFVGNEETVLSEDFKVYTPNVNFWPNRRIWAYAQTAYNEFRSFFSPITGIVYDNRDWRTLVDPISFKYQPDNLIMTAAQTPNKSVITEEEYLSVNSYFFISGNSYNASGSATSADSNGRVQFNSPAGSNSQLKNFWQSTNNGVDNRITANNSNFFYGTPVMVYRVLNETNAAEKEIIEKVKNGTLDDISEESFPLTGAGSSAYLGGIRLNSIGNSRHDGIYAPGVYTPGTELLDADIDVVMLVIHYGYDGYASATAEKGIVDFGFVHIRTINFRMYNNAPTGSDMLFNCYWINHRCNYAQSAE